MTTPDSAAPYDGPLGRGESRREHLRETRARFSAWRRHRPFWAGLWSMLAGALIAYVPSTALRLIFIGGSLIWLGILVGAIIGVAGLLLWLQPQFRVLLGVLILLLSFASFITSDFGGLILGMLLGLIGGSLAVAWVPEKRRRPPAPEAS